VEPGLPLDVICRLSAVIGFVSWLPSSTALFRGARKYCTWRKEVTHGGFDFFWNKPRILLMKEVKDVIGIMSQCKIYPEPVALISKVGLNREWDFLIENAEPGAASTLPSFSQWRAE